MWSERRASSAAPRLTDFTSSFAFTHSAREARAAANAQVRFEGNDRLALRAALRAAYRSAGGAVSTPDDERALLWVLNLSDGGASPLEIARRASLRYPVVRPAAERLEAAGLLARACPERLAASSAQASSPAT